MSIRRKRMKARTIAKAKAMRLHPTRPEFVLWQRLRLKALGVKFRPQAPMWGYIADFYCPRHNLVIELDGQCHDAERDARRDRNLEAHGLLVLRFKNQDVIERIPFVLDKIRRFLNVLGCVKARTVAPICQLPRPSAIRPGGHLAHGTKAQISG